MKTTLFLILTISLAVDLTGQTLSPELVASSGAFKDTLGINLSWSVGEPVIATFSRDENSLTQGFHQGKYIVTTLVEEKTLNYDIKVYPNPARDLLHISIEQEQALLNKHFYLADMSGKRLREGKILKKIEDVDVSALSPAVYLLHIYDGNKTVKTFKIVKKE